jgi:anti-anti-sigma regulatory factor
MDARFQIHDGLLTVAGTLDLCSAEEFRDALLRVLEEASAPRVDMEAVEDCDLATLQLLRAAVVTAAGQGTPIEVSAGEAVRRACGAVGATVEELLQGGL